MRNKMIEDTDGVVRWEYYMITVPARSDSLIETLNSWGREGWEVVTTEFYKTVHIPATQVRVVFKRPYYVGLSAEIESPDE
jgi:hypothetical protein